jgi:hypothetical protein
MMPLVSEYAVDRLYGGPEEGGWWYDSPEFVRVVHRHSSEERAIAQAVLLNERVADRTRDRFCVNGGPDTCFLVEEVEGEHALTERPRYE